MNIKTDLSPPVIDYALLSSMDPDLRKDAGDKLMNAMCTWGCFIIRGNGFLNRNLVERIQLYTLLSYGLSVETKRKLNEQYSSVEKGVYKMVLLGDEVYPGQPPNGREILELTNGAPLLLHDATMVGEQFYGLPGAFGVYDQKMKAIGMYAFQAILERSTNMNSQECALFAYRLAMMLTRTWGCNYPTTVELARLAHEMGVEIPEGKEAHECFAAVGHHLDSNVATIITPGLMHPENATLFLEPGQDGFDENSDPESAQWIQLQLKHGECVMNFGKYLHLITKGEVPYVGWHMATQPTRSLSELQHSDKLADKHDFPGYMKAELTRLMKTVGKVLIATFFNGDPSLPIIDPDTGQQTTMGAHQRKFREATGVEG